MFVPSPLNPSPCSLNFGVTVLYTKALRDVTLTAAALATSAAATRRIIVVVAGGVFYWRAAQIFLLLYQLRCVVSDGAAAVSAVSIDSLALRESKTQLRRRNTALGVRGGVASARLGKIIH